MITVAMAPMIVLSGIRLNGGNLGSPGVIMIRIIISVVEPRTIAWILLLLIVPLLPMNKTDRNNAFEPEVRLRRYRDLF